MSGSGVTVGMLERLDRLLTHRLARYGVTGGLSLLTHLLVLLILVELFGRAPVLSSIAGFLCSVVLSYSLQHSWVFRTGVPVAMAFPRFIVVTLVGLALNAVVMGGTIQLFGLHYLVAQGLAFIAVPVSNYLLNRAWTFDESDLVRRIPAADFIYLLLASTVCVWFALAGALHLDFARDMMIAADILAGDEFPLVGPELAGVIRLGPIWFYLLALLQMVGGYGTVSVALALIVASQFWLVWAIADHLGDRRAGLIWAGLLLVPTWSTFELLLISHPALTGAMVALVTFFGVRFVQSGRATALAAMSLCFVLGLHAHPTVLALWPLPLGLTLLGWVHHRVAWRGLIWALLAAAVPFAPWIVEQVLSGWPVFDSIAAYAADHQSGGKVAAAAPLLWQMTGGGLAYWWTAFFSGSSTGGGAIGLVFATLVLAGLAGSIRRAWQGDRVMLVLWATVVLGIIGLAMVRTFHAYYMISGVRIVLLGLAAFGLSQCLSGELWPRTVSRATCFCGLLMSVAVLLTFYGQQRKGEWPFAFIPLMSVTSPAHSHHPHPFLAIWTASASGDWLCANSDQVIHGAYALSIVHSYASEARLRCGPIGIEVHGDSTGDQHHVVGLSRSLLEKVDIMPEVGIGPFGLVPVKTVYTAQPPLTIGKEQAYPPLEWRFNDTQSQVVRIQPDATGLLAVTDLSFGLSLRPEIKARCGDATRPPVAQDNITWLFDPTDCVFGLVLEMRSPLPRYLNVVMLDPTSLRDAGSDQTPYSRSRYSNNFVK